MPESHTEKDVDLDPLIVNAIRYPEGETHPVEGVALLSRLEHALQDSTVTWSIR